MLIEPRVIDDLKTTRVDIIPPLPAILRLVPLLFYALLIGCAILVGLFSLQLQQVTASRDAWAAQDRKFQRDISTAKAERGALENQTKRASDLMAWVETTRPIQPVVVGLTRVIGPDSSIQEISFSRSAENQNLLRFGIKLSGTSTAPLDSVLEHLGELGYRSYSPEQKLARGQIDYSATLLWQQPGSAQETSESSVELPAP